MSDMKMSEVFHLPLTADKWVVCSNPYQLDWLPLESQVDEIECGSEKEAKMVAHAINNHDRLVEENAQQRESLDAFRKLVKVQTKTISDLKCEREEICRENNVLRSTIHKARQGYKNLIELRALPNTGWNGEAQDLIDLCDDALE